MIAVEHDPSVPAPARTSEIGREIFVAVEPDAGTGLLGVLQGSRDQFDRANHYPRQRNILDFKQIGDAIQAVQLFDPFGKGIRCVGDRDRYRSVGSGRVVLLPPDC